jgi:hypothetical protein
MLTLEAIFAHPDNAAVLRYVGLRPEDVRHFAAGTDGSPFDEGGQIFFHRYGRLIPAPARCTLERWNLMVHERTARIFALHEGRFTIALRDGASGRLQAETLDGHVDLRALGPGWALLDSDGGDEAEAAFAQAYQLAGE